VNASTAHLCAFTDAFTKTSLPAQLCCLDCLRRYSPQRTVEGSGREAGCHTGAQNVKWANSAVETQRVRAISIEQQLQRPATERVLLADLHVELRSLLSLLRNWQADQFTCIIRTPDFERGIMVKIVHIIIKFLRYYLCHLCTSDNVTTNEHQQSVQLMAYDMRETRTNCCCINSRRLHHCCHLEYNTGSCRIYPIPNNGPGDSPKIAPSSGGSGIPPNTWLFGPTRVHAPNCSWL